MKSKFAALTQGRKKISAISPTGRRCSLVLRSAMESLERRALFTVISGQPAEASLDASYVGGSLGINLATNDSFSTAALWTDVRKTMAAWQYNGQNGTVLSGADVLKNGYPSGTSASNNAYTNTEMLGYPDGVYTLTYQGVGSVTVGGSGTILGTPTTATVNGVTTTTAQIAIEKDKAGQLYLYANNFTISSPLSNLHLMMPGYAANTTQIFNPAVLARIKPFSTVRLMDLFRANNSTLANWSDRPLPSDFTATGALGISYEDAIALGNETQTNLWWNIPIDATNDFVTKLANLIKYGSDAGGNAYTSVQANPVNPPLNANLKVQIELGNEISNPGTTSYNDNHTAALANLNAGILENEADINGEQSLLRLRQIRDQFANVYDPGVTNYSDNTQLTALNGQIGFIWTGQFDALSGAEQPFTTDAIAFSKYNNELTTDDNPANWKALNSWLTAIATSNYHGLLSGQNPTTLNDLFADLNAGLTQYGPSAVRYMVNYAAQNAGLPLYAYEGGLALTPTTSDQLALFTAASSDPRMDAFNQSLLDDWYKNGGGQFDYYALATDYNYYGTWGLLQYEDQPGTNKFDGVIKRTVPTADANLDGSVNFSDFLALKSNWLKAGTYWQQGDFNGDGIVNASDLTILDASINKSAFTATQLAEYNSFYQFATTGTSNSSVGSGLYGAYFSDLNQTTKVFGRVDPSIDFNWPQGGTGPDPSVGQSYFSARWTGQIEAPTSETYSIHTYSDDGVRVYITVNGVKQTIINDYTSGSHEDVGDVTLQAGQKYCIEVDYEQQYGNANMRLEWQTPTIPLQDIPTTMMFPTTLPAVVSGVAASGGAGAIAVSFPAVSGATSYNIYRSTTPGGEGSTPYLTGITGSGATITATDGSVTTGRIYYYTVTAINGVGETAQSTEVSAASTAPVGIASAPVISAAGGAGAITLSWAAVNGATSYSIYRGTAAGGESTKALITGVSASSYIDSTALAGTTYYYTVTADNGSGSSVFSNEASAIATPSAQPTLTDLDIGSPGLAGSAAYNSTTGTYTVSGGGADVYGVGDQFNFDYTSLSGNQTLVARVASETNTDYSTKSGLMFRADTTSTSSYADVLITPGQGAVFEWRDGGSYSSTAVAGINAPAWVKLTRSGNTFTGYYSLDGINWSIVGTRTIANISTTGSLLTGLAVCAHNNSKLATATFTNVTLGSGPVVTAGPTATVNAAGTSAALAATATESGQTLSYTWAVTSLPSGETNTYTPTFSASNGTTNGNAVTAMFTRAGTYGLSLTVTDSSGHSTVAAFSVTVTQLLASISLTPASPVSVASGGTVTFAGIALDQFGVALTTQPSSITYSIDTGGAGTINAASGLYTAPSTNGTATVRGTSGSVSATAAVTITASAQTPTKLTGTVIGTTGSYDGTSTRDKVFDGSTTTFFDAPGPNGNYVGLDLGSQFTLSSISYAPRVGYESRMVGGVFQASNDPTFAGGVVTLGTITATPNDGYSTLALSAAGAYRYVRYVAPDNSYGNIAEMQVYGTAAAADTQAPTIPGTPTLTSDTSTTAAITWAASTDNVAVDHYVIYRNSTKVGTSTSNSYADSGLTGGANYSYTVTAVDPSGNTSAVSGALSVTTPTGVAAPTQLTGMVIGTAGSYDNSATDAAPAVFDGNLATFFDAPTANNNVVGLNLGAVYNLTSIKYAPRVGFETRMVGGYFQVSNSASFSNSTTLYTITAAPADVLTTVLVSGSGQYIRYVAPSGSYGNIAEMQVFGTAAVADTQPPTTPGTPTLSSDTSTTAAIAWAGSTDNVAVDHYVIYRNGMQVGTSATTSYADSGLTGGVSYSYTVTAVDAAGNVSLASGALAIVTPTGVAAPAQLTGTVFGTSGSWDGASSDSISAIFDGNTSTYFDSPTASASNSVAGLDLGTAYTLSAIKYAPRVGYENRMVGGYFQASSSSNFSNATTLYTVTSTPPDGLTSVAVTGSCRYVRYVAPANSYGNIAEMQIFGVLSAPDTQAPTMPGTPTLSSATATTATIAWTASTDNVGVDHYVIYRNGTQVGTSKINSFTDIGLSAATPYSYTVTAVDAAGNVSPTSAALAVTTTTQLTGTVIGTSGSWDGQSSDTAAAVFDGNTNTFFDSPTASASSAWVGLELGSVHSLTSLSFAPRVGYEARMVGGYFQGSNSADFSNATTLYTVTSTPVDGLTTVAVTGSYRYVRYVAPANSYGNIAEMQVFGS